MKTEFKDKHGTIINDGDMLEGDNSVIYEVKSENNDLVAYVQGYFRNDDTGRAQVDYPTPFKLADFQLSSISILNQ